MVTFVADSDSQIVRGLLSMLVMLCSERPPKEILALDIEGVFEQLGFRQHLTRSRSNGLYSVIRQIRTLAEQAMNRTGADRDN
jgi:sulfur transfer protein SufE